MSRLVIYIPVQVRGVFEIPRTYQDIRHEEFKNPHYRRELVIKKRAIPDSTLMEHQSIIIGH